MSTPAPGRLPESLVSITPFARRPWLTRPPVSLTSLIGRQQEVATATSLLRRDDVRLLTFTGPGGIGKTRLAIEVAAALEVDFADGVNWVSLATIRDSGLVMPSIARTLGIVDANVYTLPDVLVSTLRGQQLLLVLDNFEQVLDAAPHVAELLAGSAKIKILVTSRSQLRIRGEHTLPVPALTLPDPKDAGSPASVGRSAACQLFVERAQTSSPAFALTPTTAGQVVEICRRLDGLPLAIELAAARVNHLAVPTLQARLDQRLPLLTGGARDLPDRLQTMRNAIGWSYDLLTADEQALFRHLAVFAGGFTLEVAEAVAGAGDSQPLTPNVLDGLAALVDKSLVNYEPEAPGGSRYRLLEMIREYAAEQLSVHDDEGAARQRHADYFLALVEAARPELEGPAARNWLDRLDIEHPNLRAALSWLERSGQWLECLRFATILTRFWDHRGHLSEGRGWLERSLDPARTGDAPIELRATALAELGLFALRLGDIDGAEERLEEARRAWSHLGDKAGLAFTMNVLGGVAEHRGDDTDAGARYQEALALFDELGESVGRAEALNNLADTAYRQGDHAQAATLAEQAVAASREVGFPIRIVAALVSQGQAASALGDRHGAGVALREGLRLSQDLGYYLGVADVLAGLADLATTGGDATRAARLLGAADAFATGIGVPQLLHHGLYRRAKAAARAAQEEATFLAAWAEGQALTLEEAVTEAEAVSSEPPPPTIGPLTPRELDVLRLLVAGHPDRDIADELFIGHRTVQTHVAHIFEKLGVRTRAGAASAALTAGLVGPPPSNH